MNAMWNFLQLKSVLGDIALSLFCVVSKDLVSAPWNALFVSGWPEITKNGLLLLSLKSETL